MATRTLYNVTLRAVAGLVALYCMGSTREYVLSIGNGFDVPSRVCVACSARRDVFSVEIELWFSLLFSVHPKKIWLPYRATKNVIF